ncbi:putative ISXo8 transposase [Xanthomonas oryzae pv. oryzae KACC 10331]|uniref:ISXo8 transposase n=1 Tax=Xanthomonas oryzae pv. oryzae (strain KACC10331 / KXO85) TaxID=291331 RepID=Q5GZC7_XANOR|nr:putative ISXo8 transposase [Xanthomonas oryzae pv. oryzae KACC 10331]
MAADRVAAGRVRAPPLLVLDATKANAGQDTWLPRHKADGRIERDYQELKSGSWACITMKGATGGGFHHHASLCIAAYGFLMRERLRSKKNSVAFKMPAVSKSVRPRRSGPNATSPSQLDCHAGLRTG